MRLYLLNNFLLPLLAVALLNKETTLEVLDRRALISKSKKSGNDKLFSFIPNRSSRVLPIEPCILY